jgi:hypothetical protein
MNEIRPLVDTAESVTLSRADFEALQQEPEDAADRIDTASKLDVLTDVLVRPTVAE